MSHLSTSNFYIQYSGSAHGMNKRGWKKALLIKFITSFMRYLVLFRKKIEFDIHFYNFWYCFATIVYEIMIIIYSLLYVNKSFSVDRVNDVISTTCQNTRVLLEQLSSTSLVSSFIIWWIIGRKATTVRLLSPAATISSTDICLLHLFRCCDVEHLEQIPILSLTMLLHVLQVLLVHCSFF